MSDFDLVIAGTVVLPSMIIEGGYVAVRDGKVVHVGEGSAPHARERHDLGGWCWCCLVRSMRRRTR